MNNPTAPVTQVANSQSEVQPKKKKQAAENHSPLEEESAGRNPAGGGKDKSQRRRAPEDDGQTSHFKLESGVSGRGLGVEGVALTDVAREFSTPTYVYSRAAMEMQWHDFDRAFGKRRHLICYAVKACSNLAVLNLFARLGSGFDVVSGGELERVLRAGGDPAYVVFSGIGKQRDEIERALAAGIRCFNVESASELKTIEDCARGRGKTAPVSLRVNPDVDANTHAHITTGLDHNKFGVSVEEAAGLYQYAAASDALEALGVSCHIGSQITTLKPFSEAFRRVLKFALGLERDGINVRQLDLGGGLGVAYDDERPPTADDYVSCLLATLGDCPWEILIEPGRALVAAAGLLLTRVVYLKRGRRNFAVVDSAMNDLLRPALYGVRHRIAAVAPNADTAPQHYDVVGPVCESADVIARDCELAVCEGDLLAVLTAGAYGFSMAGNYNSRPRAAEVLISGGEARLIRNRETLDDLMAAESIPE